MVAPGSNGNVLTSNGSTWTSAAPAGGGVTSLNGQTGAITDTNLDSIGSYAVLVNAQNSNIAVGSTVAGSGLRYNPTLNGNLNGRYFRVGIGEYWGLCERTNNSSYPCGGTAVSGTWRRMGLGAAVVYAATVDKGNIDYFWTPALWVRIS
jgi:hypothetical protein